ncbi:MAG: hypothetical protein ACYS7Y_11975 [Planctomycetota bacterium]|jgi:hypothetical protein
MSITDASKIPVLIELQHRLNCCLAGKGDGWGNKRYLQNFLDRAVQPRLDALAPFVNALHDLRRQHHDIVETQIAIDLWEEYDELDEWNTQANDYLGIENTRAARLDKLKEHLTQLGVIPTEQP